MIRRPPRSTLSSSSAASDVYKRQPRGTLMEADMFEHLDEANRPTRLRSPTLTRLSASDLAEVRERSRKVSVRNQNRTVGKKLTKKERMRMERSLMDEHRMKMHSQEHDELRKLREVLFVIMQELPARQLLGVYKDVYTIRAEMEIAEAFNQLLERKILSAPVLDESKNKYIGFLSLMDLVAWVVLVCHEKMLQSGDLPINTLLKRESSWQQDMRRHISSKHQFPPGHLVPPDMGLDMDPAVLSETIAAHGKRLVKVFAKRRPVGKLNYEANTLEAAHMLADQHRRLALMSQDGSTILGILSQSRFANFLAVEKELWRFQLGKEALTGSLAEWGFTSKKFVSAKSSHSALEAFELMNKSNSLTLPITDPETGVLLNELRPEDLAGMISRSMSLTPRHSHAEAAASQDSLQALMLPVLDFIETVREEVGRPTTVRLNDSFAHLFDLFRQHSIRRIYVVDEDGAPIMACSLKDAIASLVYTDRSVGHPVKEQVEDPVRLELSQSGIETVDQLLPLCTIKLDDPSNIVNFVDLSWLWIHLPATSRHKHWNRVFSLQEDGSSLQSLLLACKSFDREPMVTILRDNNNFIFGCYTSESWKANVGVHGNGYSFVFSWGLRQELHPPAPPESLASSPDYISVYTCGADYNRIMMHATHQELSIGGGGSGAAIHVDQNLKNGSSLPCETFNSQVLAGSPHFTIMDVEVWTLGSI
eukprot:TRINITY_DN15992_c0_g1_i1.p1 TRINITY_DN15992_c0_g1~~TRINITY_DN15992_c0_g1_i1.p1  ORF type:complete len:706 (+),score=159.71 TRINITY_DN15992_c0_g1_i1:132-2249(+)